MRNYWMMYIAQTPDALLANMAPIQFGTDVYLRVVKPIPAGSELLVYACAEFPVSPDSKSSQSNIFKTDSE